MISLDYTLLIQMGIFLALMFLVLNPFVFRPMVSLLEERERRMKEPAAHAKDMDEEVEGMKRQYEESLGDARLKAIEDRERLRKDGVEREQEIIKEAYRVSEEMVSEVKKGIEKELMVAREALRREAKDLSLDVAQRVLGRTI